VVADLLPRARRTSFLQLEASAFVGRGDELVELGRAVAASRLVTLVGEAGVGKTRLSLRFAATQRSAYESVWFCDLRDARDVEGMSAALARTLSIADEATTVGDTAATAVGRALASRGRTLLVLDNIDPLLPTGADVVLTWLDLALEAHLVVTSRAPLDLIGEELLHLSPLPLPSPLAGDRLPDAVSEDGGSAVALFIERVRAFKDGFVPSGDEARAIAEVVRRVRGVPLAIELCASRFQSGDLRSLGLRGAARVGHDGGPTDPIEWSFCKLDLLEREALAQCSVFRGGFTFEAAERVVELPAHPWPMPRRIGGVLAMLLQKSLLQPIRTGHADALPRFTVCEGIRAHAARLVDQGVEASGAPWRHAQFYLDLASGPLTDLPGPGAGRPPITREELAAERENLEAVLDFGATRRRPDLVLRAAVALDFLASGTGISRAMLTSLDDALTASATLDPAMVGRALGVRAGALRALGRLEEAERDAQTALFLARRAGSSRQIVAMHLAVGGACFQLGYLEGALTHSRAAAEAARAGGHGPEESLGLQQIGAVLQAMSDPAGARAHYEAALQVALDGGDPVGEARAAMGLGSYHLEAGDLARAEASYDRALLIAHRRGMTRNARIVTGYLGVLHFDAGRPQEAERCLDSAARSSRSVGDPRVEGIFSGIRGAALASLDLLDEARAAFTLAHQLLAQHPYFHAVIAVHQGHLELAEAREVSADGDTTRAGALVRAAGRRILDAEACDGEGPPLVCRSDDARIAVRILRRALGEWAQ